MTHGTVQGCEADSVILVLGAPLPGQHGARSWAGAKPNLLKSRPHERWKTYMSWVPEPYGKTSDIFGNSP